jgi:predicted glycogen debranching enzyme
MSNSRSTPLSRIIPLEPNGAKDRDKRSLESEWIITNGIGGYASGTLAGINTRRFHGWLIAALPAPHGRTMMLNQLEELLTVCGKRHMLVAEDLASATQQDTVSDELVEFRLEDGLPVWTYRCESFELEKRACLGYRQNTVYIRYTLIRGENASLELRPSIDIRPHEGILAGPNVANYRLTASAYGYEISCTPEIPPLLLAYGGEGAEFHLSRQEIHSLQYREEQNRGYDWEGNLWSPGYFSANLSQDQTISLCASAENWERVAALTIDQAFRAERLRRRRLLQAAPEEARSGIAGELVLAADQFLIVPVGRVADTVRAQAVGEEIRTVIAGYHWFTDWGRDTMISLEGLTLATGRYREAEFILRSFAEYIHHGLIPNLFPEGNTSGLYHTADATLWFFHAIDRFIETTGDREMLKFFVPKMIDVAEWHLQGTDFGIHVDPTDGLLSQGAPGYQLTWMDAKVRDWVVTPRRGKAVEINALWYNALCLLSSWTRELGDDAHSQQYQAHADRARESFAKKFWYQEGNYLYDVIEAEPGAASVIDGNDHSCRPNQLLAISLKNSILDEAHWPQVLERTQAELLTPVGLRSLAPGSPGYVGRYFGDLSTRDGGYHQGTVWAWLIGPFVDAWLKVHPEQFDQASSFLEGFSRHLSAGGIGMVSEVFDAEQPYTPRACISQAWSVAEVLRLTLLLNERMSFEQSRRFGGDSPALVDDQALLRTSK